jgi:hypothetical protein
MFVTTPAQAPTNLVLNSLAAEAGTSLASSADTNQCIIDKKHIQHTAYPEPD